VIYDTSATSYRNTCNQHSHKPEHRKSRLLNRHTNPIAHGDCGDKPLLHH
jgi:hypothetical protein